MTSHRKAGRNKFPAPVNAVKPITVISAASPVPILKVHMSTAGFRSCPEMRSKPAAARIKPVKTAVEMPNLTERLDKVRGLRRVPGMQRVVLSCPACDAKRIKEDAYSAAKVA